VLSMPCLLRLSSRTCFRMMGQLHFLIPWRALLWHEYWRGILFYCFCSSRTFSAYHLDRTQALAARHRTKLKHLDQEFAAAERNSPPKFLPASARIDQERISLMLEP